MADSHAARAESAFRLFQRNDPAQSVLDRCCMAHNAGAFMLLKDPDLTVGRMMEIWPQTIEVFLRHLMLCIGCPVRRFYTVAEACQVYRLSLTAFLDEVQTAIG
jgi:hybrid cluster-associated redox disulfide protein